MMSDCVWNSFPRRWGYMLVYVRVASSLEAKELCAVWVVVVVKVHV